MLPPNWRLLVSTRFGFKVPKPDAYVLNALSPGSSYLPKRLPCMALVPFLDTTLTWAPEVRPSSAEYDDEETVTSFTDSWFGVTTAAPPHVWLFTPTPSIW